MATLWTEMRVVLAKSRDANCLASYGAAQVDAVEAANAILNRMPADVRNDLATLRRERDELRAELLTTHQMACRVGLERDELRAKQGEAP